MKKILQLFLVLVMSMLFSVKASAVFEEFGKDKNNVSGLIDTKTGLIANSEESRRGLPPVGSTVIQVNNTTDREKDVYLTDSRRQNSDGSYGVWKTIKDTSVGPLSRWHIALNYVSKTADPNAPYVDYYGYGKDAFSGREARESDDSLLVVDNRGSYKGRAIRMVVDINQRFTSSQRSSGVFSTLYVYPNGRLEFESGASIVRDKTIYGVDFWYEYQDNGARVVDQGNPLYIASTFNMNIPTKKLAYNDFTNAELNRLTKTAQINYNGSVDYLLTPDDAETLDQELRIENNWNGSKYLLFNPSRGSTFYGYSNFRTNFLTSGSQNINFQYIGHYSRWGHREVIYPRFNLNDPEAFSPLPEAYFNPYINYPTKTTKEHDELYFEASFSQHLKDHGDNKNFYPFKDSFVMNVEYEHAMDIKETDFEYYLVDDSGSETLIKNPVNYVTSKIISDTNVQFLISQNLLFLSPGETLTIKQLTKVPSDESLIKKYQTTDKAFLLPTTVTSSYEDILGPHVQASTEDVRIGYEPELSNIDPDKVYYDDVNKKLAKELDFNDISKNFDSSFPEDVVKVTPKNPNQLLEGLGKNNKVPVILTSSKFGVTKEDMINVKLSEITSFTYKIKRDEELFKLEQFQNRSDLANRFKQMIILTPKNINLIEPTDENGNVLVPSVLKQPETITNNGNKEARSYQFNQALNTNGTKALEDYLAKLKFEIVSDFDQPNDIQIIFRNVLIANNLEISDPRNAISFADVPQKVVVTGKNSKGDILYTEDIKTNLVIDEKNITALKEVEHYHKIKETDVSILPQSDVTTKEITYTAKDYMISYHANGGKGNINNQSYSILDDSIKLSKGNELTKERFNLVGWVTKDLKTTYDLEQQLDKKKLPGNLELLADWKPETVKAEVKFLYKDTDKAVFGDLEKLERKKSELINEANVGESIDELLKTNNVKTAVKGYELIPEYQVTVGNTKINDGKIPEKDFTITYYYHPLMMLDAPESVSFGQHKRLNNHKKSRYALDELSKDDTISIIDTKEQSDWALSAYANRLRSSTISLNSKLTIIDEDNKNYVLSEFKEEIVLDNQQSLYKEIALKSPDNKKGMFLDIYGTIPEDGEYSTTIHLMLERVP